MNSKYYVDVDGNYLGAFCGAEPPEAAIEIQQPPAHGLDKWIDGAWVAFVIEPSKQEKLEKITVTTQSGKTFDGNDTAISRMGNAIMVAERVGAAESQWIMANNDKLLITLDELKEAHTLAMMRLGDIVLGS